MARAARLWSHEKDVGRPQATPLPCLRIRLYMDPCESLLSLHKPSSAWWHSASSSRLDRHISQGVLSLTLRPLLLRSPAATQQPRSLFAARLRHVALGLVACGQIPEPPIGLPIFEYTSTSVPTCIPNSVDCMSTTLLLPCTVLIRSRAVASKYLGQSLTMSYSLCDTIRIGIQSEMCATSQSVARTTTASPQADRYSVGPTASFSLAQLLLATASRVLRRCWNNDRSSGG